MPTFLQKTAYPSLKLILDHLEQALHRLSLPRQVLDGLHKHLAAPQSPLDCVVGLVCDDLIQPQKSMRPDHPAASFFHPRGALFTTFTPFPSQTVSAGAATFEANHPEVIT